MRSGRVQAGVAKGVDSTRNPYLSRYRGGGVGGHGAKVGGWMGEMAVDRGWDLVGPTLWLIALHELRRSKAGVLVVL